MTIVSVIGEILKINTAARRRSIGQVKHLVVHRNSIAKDPIEMAQRFRDPSLKTGGAFPYHFLVLDDETVYQCLPLTKIGEAAKGLNTSGIQLCAIGDFRKSPPSAKQYSTLVDLAALLSGAATDILGHTERTGHSLDPNKICPGKHLSLDKFRADVEKRRTVLPRNLDPRAYGVIL